MNLERARKGRPVLVNVLSMKLTSSFHPAAAVLSSIARGYGGLP